MAADPIEPEREVVRRVLPFAPLVIAVAFGLGFLLDDAGAGWSAALAVILVALNLVASALSLAWAAGISPIAVYAVGLGGFAVRLLVFLLALVALDRLSWFSPVAFAAAFVPTTIALLAYEMKIISGRRIQADLWYFRERT
jgi:hypothetical protein